MSSLGAANVEEGCGDVFFAVLAKAAAEGEKLEAHHGCDGGCFTDWREWVNDNPRDFESLLPGGEHAGSAQGRARL
ncbi:hypothetical protein [Dyella sp. 2RAB6]|uniref:hypothetical protein n=1 Tax=Dyella sp. 2RAB6 TaxID=3232992 RepID=UPI003F8E4FDA